MSLCVLQDASLDAVSAALSLTFSWRAGMQGKDALHQYVQADNPHLPCRSQQSGIIVQEERSVPLFHIASKCADLHSDSVPICLRQIMILPKLSDSFVRHISFLWCKNIDLAVCIWPSFLL